MSQRLPIGSVPILSNQVKVISKTKPAKKVKIAYFQRKPKHEKRKII